MSLSPAQIPFRAIGRWLLVFAAVYLVGWLLWSAASALTPFIVGLALAYLLLPLVNKLNLHMPRWAAILIVYLIAISGLTIFFSYIFPPLIDQISQLIGALPSLETLQEWANMGVAEYEQLLTNLPENIRGEVQQGVASALSTAANTIRTNFVDYLQNVGAFLLNSVLSVVNTVTFLLGFFLIPFWLFYVMMDQRKGGEALNVLIHRRLRADFWAVVTIVDKVFAGYLRGQLLLGVAVGAASAFGLFVLRLFGLEVPYILLLAVIAGITELIPVIGPIIGAVPAVILGFTDSPTTGLAVIALYAIIQQLENNFLVPRIVGESVGIHPAILMVLLVVCAQVFGLIGAILSAPMGAVFRDVFTYLYGRLSNPPIAAGDLPDRLRDAAGTPRPPDEAENAAVAAAAPGVIVPLTSEPGPLAAPPPVDEVGRPVEPAPPAPPAEAPPPEELTAGAQGSRRA